MTYKIKDSGERREFKSGMMRDTTKGKIDYLSCRFGPMFKRWNQLLTAGREKYPDPEVGVPNWTLGNGPEELDRARQSAARHFEQWLAGDADEDHGAAVFFNINLAEYVKERMEDERFRERTDADPGIFNRPLVQQLSGCDHFPVMTKRFRADYSTLPETV